MLKKLFKKKDDAEDVPVMERAMETEAEASAIRKKYLKIKASLDQADSKESRLMRDAELKSLDQSYKQCMQRLRNWANEMQNAAFSEQLERLMDDLGEKVDGPVSVKDAYVAQEMKKEQYARQAADRELFSGDSEDSLSVEPEEFSLEDKDEPVKNKTSMKETL